MTAAWEFIEDNRGFLTRWAKKFIRINLAYMPDGYYEADELLDQVYIDLPLYRLDNHNGLRKGIFNSFYGISCGGCSHYYKQRKHYESSLDAPLSVSGRSGDSEDGGTLKDLLPSPEPTPYEVLAAKEHVKEIAPRYFAEIGKVCGKNGGEVFRDIIEAVFFGFTFEEVERYAKI